MSYYYHVRMLVGVRSLLTVDFVVLVLYQVLPGRWVRPIMNLRVFEKSFAATKRRWIGRLARRRTMWKLTSLLLPGSSRTLCAKLIFETYQLVASG